MGMSGWYQHLYDTPKSDQCIPLTHPNIFFHFYFSAKDLSLNNVYGISIFFRDVKNIPLEGTVSQIFYLGLSFNFI